MKEKNKEPLFHIVKRVHRAYIRSLDMIFQELRLSSQRMGQKFQLLQ